MNHEAEANIIAQAGRLAAVTIATNMAGRGTDILLGGNPEFLARAEMENDWVRRTSNLPTGSVRYEDVLAQLREQFDAAVEQAREDHEPKWQPCAEAQAQAPAPRARPVRARAAAPSGPSIEIIRGFTTNRAVVVSE